LIVRKPHAPDAALKAAVKGAITVKLDLKPYETELLTVR
jgi:hypothetical protein